MRPRRKVLEMFQDEDTETEMFAKCVKHIVHCFLELNIDEDTTVQEAMGTSLTNESIA